jgi:hypothetical protein
VRCAPRSRCGLDAHVTHAAPALAGPSLAAARAARRRRAALELRAAWRRCLLGLGSAWPASSPHPPPPSTSCLSDHARSRLTLAASRACCFSHLLSSLGAAHTPCGCAVSAPATDARPFCIPCSQAAPAAAPARAFSAAAVARKGACFALYPCSVQVLLCAASACRGARRARTGHLELQRPSPLLTSASLSLANRLRPGGLPA